MGLLGLLQAVAHDDEVVREADDLTHNVLGPGRVERMQEDVGQHRRDDPALRCTGDRLDHRPNLDPLTQQLQDPTIRHAPLDERHEPVVIDRPEEVPDVRLEHELLALRERRTDLLQLNRRTCSPELCSADIPNTPVPRWGGRTFHFDYA